MEPFRRFGIGQAPFRHDALERDLRISCDLVNFVNFTAAHGIFHGSGGVPLCC